MCLCSRRRLFSSLQSFQQIQSAFGGRPYVRASLHSSHVLQRSQLGVTACLLFFCFFSCFSKNRCDRRHRSFSVPIKKPNKISFCGIRRLKTKATIIRIVIINHWPSEHIAVRQHVQRKLTLQGRCTDSHFLNDYCTAKLSLEYKKKVECAKFPLFNPPYDTSVVCLVHRCLDTQDITVLNATEYILYRLQGN